MGIHADTCGYMRIHAAVGPGKDRVYSAGVGEPCVEHPPYTHTHTMGTGASPTAPRRRSPRQDRAGQGTAPIPMPTPIPALTCSPQPGGHLLPQTCRPGAEGRRRLGMGSGQRAAAPALPPSLPPRPPGCRRGSCRRERLCAFVTPPLPVAVARCWAGEPGLQLLRLSSAAAAAAAGCSDLH